MKKRFSKLLGYALTTVLVISVLVAAPAAALTQPQVSIPFGGNVIDQTTTYTLSFTAGSVVPTAGHIVVTFPAGTDLSGVAITDVKIQALTGIGGGDGVEYTASNVTVAGVVGAPQIMTITLNKAAAQDIGQGSLVGVKIANVKNPATPGTYTLDVGTSGNQTVPVTIEAAVSSASYAITAPTPTPLPGVVSAYNSAGILMQQSNSIQVCVNAAGIGGKIEVGPGTYDEDITITQARQTLIATGAPGTVIINNADRDAVEFGTITVNVAGTSTQGGVTIDGFTFTMPTANKPATPINIGAAASYVTVKNCTIASGTTSAVAVNGASTKNTIQDCTIDATSATAGLIGIQAMGQTTIKNCTITVGSSAASQAITSSGGTGAPLSNSAVTDCTITGSSGKGIAVSAGVVKISGNELASMNNALAFTGGTATVYNNTIDTCGGSLSSPGNPITVVAPAIVTMYNNTIQNSSDTYHAIAVTSGNLTAYMNNILNNAKNVTVTAGQVDVTHNWWGAAAGPAAGTVVGTSATPVLTNAVGSGSVALNNDKVTAKDTVGVDVACLTNTGTASTVGAIAVSKYSSNPATTSPLIKGTGSVLGYYDVYVSGGAPVSIQIKFYGAVNNYCKLYYAGGLGGEWVPVTASAQGVNTAGGYVYAVLTGSTSPSINDLGGTPFALIEDKTFTPPSIAVGTGSPVIGAYDVSIDPMFTWGPVAGALRYEIALSEDPTFTIIEWSYNVDQTFYKVDEALRYDTTYYWRVRGVLGEPYQEGGQWLTPSTPWTVGIFTTEAEPAPPTEAIVVEPTKPEVNVEIPPTKITVEPSTPAIPTYMLWVIVVVGAVLVIALIVLIVRTRRVV